MNTDRTQPTRPAALNDRSSAAPAERRDGSAFAALLDAHAPAPRAEQSRRDERAGGRASDSRDARHDRPRDGGVGHDGPQGRALGHDGPRDGDNRAHASELSRDAARLDLHAVGPQAPFVAPAAENVVMPPVEGLVAGQPVAVPFVATIPAEAPAAAPALPVAPPFMLAPEAVAAAVVAATPQPAAVPAGAAVALAPQPAAPAVPAAGQPVATVPAPAAAQPQDAAPAPAQPAVPQAQVPVAAPEAELPAEPVAAPVAEAPAAPVPHAATPARAAEPAPAAAAPAQGPATEPVAPAPVSTPLSGPVAPQRAVPLHRAPAAVSTLLHVAVERGISRAKMALKPAELGGIEIRLQATAGGVAAQVVADSPEAARLLAQAGEDLRRALEARDVTLISLEVSTSADQQQRQSARGEWSDALDDRLTSPGRSARDADGDAEPAPSTQTVIELPGGLLVDVLA